MVRHNLYWEFCLMALTWERKWWQIYICFFPCSHRNAQLKTTVKETKSLPFHLHPPQTRTPSCLLSLSLESEWLTRVRLWVLALVIWVISGKLFISPSLGFFIWIPRITAVPASLLREDGMRKCVSKSWLPQLACSEGLLNVNMCCCCCHCRCCHCRCCHCCCCHCCCCRCCCHCRCCHCCCCHCCCHCRCCHCCCCWPRSPQLRTSPRPVLPRDVTSAGFQQQDGPMRFHKTMESPLVFAH